MRPTADDEFNTELLKLLVQVAWGDDELGKGESEAIYGLGRSWNVPEGALTELRERLQAGKGLPAPNLGLLRGNPDAVLEAVRALVAVDGRLAESEVEMTVQVRGLLDGTG